MFNRAERFEQFWWTVTLGTFLYDFFKIDALVKEKSIEGFSIFIALAAILFNGAERLSNFGRQSPKEHSCEIISKSIHRFSRSSCLKFISIYSPGGHFVQCSGIV